MNWGDFRALFRGVAWKPLSDHEVNPGVSNGHEFQGVSSLKRILGSEPLERIPTTYVLLRDEEEPEILRLWASWYDARFKDHTRSAEWRLYYPSAAGQIQAKMRAGDGMLVAQTQKGELLILLTRRGSDSESKVAQLFGIDERLLKLQIHEFDAPVVLDFLGAALLEDLGIANVHAPIGGDADSIASIVDELWTLYPEKLPRGEKIAELVRSRVSDVDDLVDPDHALYRWIEAEAAMFRGWEDRKIAARVKAGFLDATGDADVDAFRTFSMSIRQSRVSRAGGALQFHFRALLKNRNISHEMEPVVDGGESPDFLFPSKAAYENSEFPADKLHMLAAKYTAKDRWRQVLNEAKRVRDKHLLTLESTISANQMSLMHNANLRLVIPNPVRARYRPSQAASVLSISDFLQLVQSSA